MHFVTQPRNNPFSSSNHVQNLSLNVIDHNTAQFIEKNMICSRDGFSQIIYFNCIIALIVYFNAITCAEMHYLKFPSQSKAMIKSLLKNVKITTLPKSAQFPNIKDIDFKFSQHKLQTLMKIVQKFHVAIFKNY